MIGPVLVSGAAPAVVTATFGGASRCSAGGPKRVPAHARSSTQSTARHMSGHCTWDPHGRAGDDAQFGMHFS